MMEVRYIVEDDSLRKVLLRDISKQIYKGNSLFCLVKLCDFLLVLLFSALVYYFFRRLGGLIDAGVIECCAAYDEDFSVRFFNHLRWALLIGAYLVMMYAVVIRPAIISRLIRQMSTVLIRGENLLAVRDDGLYHAGHYGHSLLRYSEVRRVADMRGFLVIFVGRGHFHAVPYSAFTSDEQRKQFADLLRSKVDGAEHQGF